MFKNVLTLLFVAGLFGGLLGGELELFVDSSMGADALPSALLKSADQAYAQNVKGLDALDKADYDGALAFFDEALKIVPNYTDAMNNRAVVFYRRGLLFKAREIWEQLYRQDPRYSLAQYNLGVLAFHESKMQPAEQLFREVLKANRRFSQAYVMLARIKLAQNKVAEALDNLEKAYAIDSKAKDVWSLYAFGLIRSGDTSAAQILLRAHQEHYEAKKMLGTLAALQKRSDEALKYLSAAAQQGGEAELLLNLATVQVEQKLFEQARSTLQRYLKMTATAAAADGWLLAGFVERELGALKEAQRLFEQGLHYYPHDPILQYNLGQLYFHANDFAAAEAAWQNLDDTLQDPALHHLRALAALRQGQHARALDQVSRALSLDERAEYYDLRGVLLHKKGDEQGARTAFKRALQLDPHLRSAQLNVALLGQSPQDAQAAVAAAREQLAGCSSDCGEVALQLAIVLYYQKDLAEAIAVLERCNEKDKDERIYRHLALFYREQGQWDKAISVLQQARKRYVLSAQSEGELAEALLLAGRYSQAIELYTALLGKWEGNPWRLYYQLGYACLEQNELEKAKNFFERSLKSKSDNVAARGLLAFVHNRLGNRKQARGLWEQNLKDDPTNPVLLINLALMHESSGELLKALEYYQKAQQLNPSDKTVELNIGNVYAALGRTADALNSYAQALQSSRREEAAYNIFLLAHKNHQQPRAEEMVSILKTEFPHSALTTRALADKQLASGDTTGALRALESLKQKQTEDWYMLARLYAQRGAVEQARTAVQQLPRDSLWRAAATAVSAQIAFAQGDCATALSLWQSLADTSFAARYNRALVSYTCKRYAEVVEGGSALVEGATGGDRADVCRLVGNAAFQLKQWDKARRWYRQLSALEARDAIVQYNLAVASYNLHELDDAWKHYQQARQLDASLVNKDIEARYQQRASTGGSGGATALDTRDSLYNVAVDLQQQGEGEQAQVLYQRILEQDSTHIQAWNNLGALLAARGELDEAEQCYLRVVKRRFDLPESYANLIHLYLAQGNFKEARRWVIKGRGHNPDSELLQTMEKTVADSLAVQR